MICNQFVKVLFPFRYEKEEDNNLEDITVINDKGNEKHLFERFGFDNINLRKGVQGLFSEKENVSRIVKCYRIVYDARAYVNLPRRKDEALLFYTREKRVEKPYSVAIKEVQLYLFESGVGFVEMECEFESHSVSDYINCNYFLSEIKTGANYFVTTKREWNCHEDREEKVEIRFTVKELLQNILCRISGVKDFYSDKSWSDTQEKGVIYSYLYLEEKTKDFDLLLFNIRNNYKESYKVPQRCKSIEEDSNIRQQFENSYWVTSYNGTINVSHKTDDETTNLFFERDFSNKMRNIYYVLFLAVLHQRFSIFKSMMEMIEINNLNLSYDAMKQQLVDIRNYQAEVHKLKFRAFFEKPSYIQHINEYYELLNSSYCVDELYTDLSKSLEDVKQICSVYVEKMRMYEELLARRRSAKIEIFVSVFGTIVGMVTMLNDAWELLEKVFGVREGSFTILVLLTTLFLWFPSVVVYVNAINKLKEIKEITEEIRRENIVTGNVKKKRSLRKK